MLISIRECGESRTGTLRMKYSEVVSRIGEPNCTDMDDPDKVQASWGFRDERGRKGFVWAYKYYGNIFGCNNFSVDGDKELLREVFGDAVS